MSSDINNLYEFAGFRFDARLHNLWRDDELIALNPKASGLLKLLLERNGDFVSKEEIFELVWADTFVEDGVLTQNIYTLRKALATNGDSKPLIENRTRLGYRITVPVSAPADAPDADAPSRARNRDTIDEIVFGERAGAAGVKSSRWSKKAVVILGFAVVVLATTGVFGYRLFRPRIASYFRKPIDAVHFQSLTNTGDVWFPAISPDGNFVAFVKKNAIYLQDLASGKEIKLDIPNVSSVGVLQFSADGNFIYFRPSQTVRQDASILKVSRFGGETRLIAEKTWGSFGLSHDGRQIVFTRNQADQTHQTLVVKDLNSGDEREIASVNFPELFLYKCSPAWSPDDKKIAFVIENFAARRTSLFVIDPADHRQQEIKTPLRQYEQIAWAPDGDALIASASEGGKFFHLWKIFTGEGDIQRITNALDTFGRVSISADGKKLIALQTIENSNLFVADAANLSEQRQLTTGNTNNIGQTALRWAGDDKLVFAAYTEENPMSNLWTVNIADGARQPLTLNTDFNAEAPTVTADGRQIYFTTTKNAFVNVWRMDQTGGSLTQITDGKDGWRMNPQISPDGQTLYYIFRTRDGGGIRSFSLADNSERTLLEIGRANPVATMSIAPDGKHLTFMNWANKPSDDDDKTNHQYGVVSTEDPSDLRFYDAKLINQTVQMTADGKAFDYVSWEPGEMMILRQNLDGGPPQQVFMLPNGHIFNFAWSKTGDRLAVSQGHSNRDVVLLTNID